MSSNYSREPDNTHRQRGAVPAPRLSLMCASCRSIPENHGKPLQKFAGNLFCQQHHPRWKVAA
jgi:hypothetical protein